MCWVLVTSALAAYFAVLCLYRIFISPLSQIPVPILAAATGWYETYYELWHSFGGQYLFHIQDLHQRYGPIVRISPWEVHIDDPEFYERLYSSREALQKPQHLKWRFFSPNALFSTPEHHLHRIRRSSQDPFFAKSRINRFAPEIQALTDRMCQRLRDDFSRQGKPVSLNEMFTSFVGDVTTHYSFDRDFQYLKDPNFQSPFTREIRSFLDMVRPCTQFPWMARLLYMAPKSAIQLLQPAAQGLKDFQEAMNSIIRQAKQEVSEERFDPTKTVMHGILSSTLPASEKRDEVLIDQAAGLVAAGIVSTRWTLTLACYHIISNHEVWTKLRKELEHAIPDPGKPLSLLQLEHLPYLNACVEEAIRLACGQITRSPRISHLLMTYKQHVIPPGTQISMDTWRMHHNEVIFPESYTFMPERWMGDARAPDGKSLKHYMVALGKGARNCLGMNLARATIRIALGTLVRKCHFELVDTCYDMDVKIVRDVVAPDTHPESKGVRLLVR